MLHLKVQKELDKTGAVVYNVYQRGFFNYHIVNETPFTNFEDADTYASKKFGSATVIIHYNYKV